MNFCGRDEKNRAMPRRGLTSVHTSRGGDDMAPKFGHRRLAATPDVMAPDGSEVRLLSTSPRGSMAHFRLPPGGVSKAVRHRSVEELWFFTAGSGQMWRRDASGEEVLDVEAGMSIDIPVGTSFQFRAASDAPLEAVAVTMPPWPSMEEAEFVEGVWEVRD
jgi:mannose-6-phosphate isomerase-like protein (cupin superfamily)